jgi:hypothetical protein
MVDAGFAAMRQNVSIALRAKPSAVADVVAPELTITMRGW